MPISVKLPVFEGPLDLLLHLIEKNKIDIYDIPITKITDQYLEYVHQMDREDMDVTSEFLVMAATLLDIKSRMLLPREVDSETGEEEADPREELVQRLLEYKMYKYLSEELSVCREQAGVRYFRSRNLPREVRTYQPPIDYGQLLKGTDLNSLQKVFGEVLRRKKSRRDPIRGGFGKIRPEEVNIESKSLYIRAYLKVHPRTDFRALLESQESREEVIVTFLILLELMKTQKVQIVQDSIGGKILIETVPSDRTPASAEAAPEETADVALTGSPEQASQTVEDEDRLTADSPQADEDRPLKEAAPEGGEPSKDAPVQPDEDRPLKEAAPEGGELSKDAPVQADEEPLPEGPAQADDESLPEGPAQADEGIEKENPPRNSSMPLLAFRDAKVIETAVPMLLPPLTLPEEIKTPLFQDQNTSGLQEEEAPGPAEAEDSIPQEAENCPDDCPPAAFLHFSDRLWHGKLPRYSGLGGRRGSVPGTAPSSSFRGFAGSRRVRCEDPAWKEKRLMRRWGHP
ncbi:MAG: hypothetical protein E7239_02735 [Sarcina sp.]|nr:hypothetical protein [Sarcina sp.]